jgi:hypothetical protein
MKKRVVLLLSLLAVVGVFLLGSGITSMVISQSCCFPPDCPAEYLCDSAQPILESPMTPARIGSTAGVILLAISVFTYFVLSRKD